VLCPQPILVFTLTLVSAIVSFRDLSNSLIDDISSASGDLYGAKISIDLGQDEPKEYEMPPVFGNKKEAKGKLSFRCLWVPDLQLF
jgi:hypothetical protein